MKNIIRFSILAVVATISVVPMAMAEEASVDEAFNLLKQYEYGKPRQPLLQLERYIGESTKDAAKRKEVAGRLCAMLTDPKVSMGAKKFIFGQLPLVADSNQVPMLIKMFGDPKLAELARGMLEEIPGEKSAEALRASLTTLKGKALVGAVNSAGIRRDAKSAPALAGMLNDPVTRVAAVRSLGKIGTVDASKALANAKGDKSFMLEVYDAQLRCAEQLADDGNAAEAETIYSGLCSAKCPATIHVAGLAGLAKTGGENALSAIVGAMASDNTTVRKTALRLSGKLTGKGISAALGEKLEKLGPGEQVLLIDVIAGRGGSSAAGAVMKLIDSENEAVQVAAILAMGAIGNEGTILKLAKKAASGTGDVQQAARGSLARIPGAAVEEALIKTASEGSPAIRMELIRATGERRSTGATSMLLKAATDKDQGVRHAALDALAVTGQADGYPTIVELLATPTDVTDSPLILKAAQGIGSRANGIAAQTVPVLRALKTAPAASRPALLQLAATFGGADALAVMNKSVSDPDKAVSDAAVRALAAWPDVSAGDALIDIAKTSKNKTHQVLALRGYFRLAGTEEDADAKLKMFEKVRAIATTADAKRLLLSGLGSVPDEGTLKLTSSFVGDKEVDAEAGFAMIKIAKELIKTNRGAVLSSMEELADKSKNETVIKQAKALITDAKKPVRVSSSNNSGLLKVDKTRSAKRKAALDKKAPGAKVACYIDCGRDKSDRMAKGPMLAAVSGSAFAWGGSDRVADSRYGSIFYDGKEVAFEATGLNGRKFYQVGFSWWDYDHNDRTVAVSASGGGKTVELLGATKLPSYSSGQNKPAEIVVPIPQALSSGGKVKIMFNTKSGANVTVSELWLIEGDKKPEGAKGDKGEDGAVKPVGTIPKPKRTDATHVLIVTGNDYPGHKWKLTTPVLAKAIGEDKRLEVQVLEDVELMASPDLHTYDVIVLHYMNWKTPPPQPEALENFRKFVADGKGLVVVHFACGAFQKWPEFVKIAGRVWNPKFRGHDPRGKFTVDMTDEKHPVTAGMKPFETSDELYTCLDGKTPITVLAESKSKVDKKMYPMAFVLNYEKGRVFHSPLGHDVTALSTPGAQELFRRGTAWAAGLAPVE